MKKLFIIGMVLAILLIAAPALALTIDYPLYAGKDSFKNNVPVGKVNVERDTTDLYITYTLNEGWYINDTHLDVKEYASDFPQKNGNAIPGKFAYSSLNQPPVSEYTYQMPRPPFEVMVIAAQADISHKTGDVFDASSGAWAGNKQFPGKNWDLYFFFPPEPV